MRCVICFDGAPSTRALAGGYAIELFLGKPIRNHGDTNVLPFRDEQLDTQSWLNVCKLYAANLSGTLRYRKTSELLPEGINDICLYHQDIDAWRLQLS